MTLVVDCVLIKLVLCSLLILDYASSELHNALLHRILFLLYSFPLSELTASVLYFILPVCLYFALCLDITSTDLDLS